MACRSMEPKFEKVNELVREFIADLLDRGLITGMYEVGVQFNQSSDLTKITIVKVGEENKIEETPIPDEGEKSIGG